VLPRPAVIEQVTQVPIRVAVAFAMGYPMATLTRR
jgi:hypothetical protein